MGTSFLTTEAGLSIRRLDTVNQVEVTVEPDDALRKLGLQSVPVTSSLVLPAQFYLGSGWQLTHLNPRTNEPVTWNPKSVNLFSSGASLSSYHLRDEALLDVLAGLFSALVPHRDSSDMGIDYEYQVARRPVQALSDPLAAVIPRLFLYSNAAKSAWFVALYNPNYPSREHGMAVVNTVSVHEIVQVEIADQEAFLYRINRAQQAAIRYKKELWG